MSTSTRSMPNKPKRPLSGYNLFYRYKRNKVVEATSRPDANDDDRRNKAVIHAVLTSLPGLEDFPPTFPLCDLPPARLNEIRAARIRTAMEGKLFPNDDPSRRLHCKVHGMGFVEMGRVMRQMWAQADKLTKDVFCELADEGRVRYRRLMAEYKLGGTRLENVKRDDTPNCGFDKPAENPAENSARTVDQSEEVAPASSFLATTLVVASATDPMKTEATAEAKASEILSITQKNQSTSVPMLKVQSAWPTNNTPVAVAATSESKKGTRPSCGRRVSLDLDFQAPVPSEAQSHGCGPGYLSKPLAFNSTANVVSDATEKSVRPRYQRRVSSKAAELDLCDNSLFAPLPAERAPGPVAMDSSTPKTRAGHGRRVSADIAPQLNSRAMIGNGRWTSSGGYGRRVSTDVSSIHTGNRGTVGALAMVSMGNGSTSSHSAGRNLQGLKTNLELEKIVLRNAIQNIKYKIIWKNSLLPSDMRVFPEGGMVPQAQENNPGQKAYLEIMTGGPTVLSGHAGGNSNNNTNPSSGTNGPVKRGSFVQDSVELIDELDDVIEEHGIADGAYGSGPSFVYDKPALRALSPDLRNKPAPWTTVPMPAGVDLKNHRARMA